NHLRPWIRGLIKAKTTWADIRKNVVDGAYASYNVEEKIDRLINIRQLKNESITSCTNRFEAYAKL
ncbi:16849_t:CDS:1, partial [Gigaspora rosea]